MKMRFLILAMMMAPASTWAAGVTIGAVSGSVEYRFDKQAAWKTATSGTEVPEGGSIRTGNDGRTSLQYPNKATVWLKPSTTVEIEERQPLSNRLALMFGAIKARVPHLKRREKFAVRTTQAVAAVRGTVFTTEANKNGDITVKVLFGQVNLAMTVPGETARTFKITQGNGFFDGKAKQLTPDQEKDGMENWAPGLAEGQRDAGLREKERSRQSLRHYARESGKMNRDLARARQDLKSSDFETGRTLTDVHGNLVRVDSRFDRPDGKTLQVLNVVKRTGYASGGFRTYTYNGVNSSRIDSARIKVKFNQDLPENLNEIPGFMSSNESTLKVDQSEMVLANQADTNNIFVVAFMGVRSGTVTDDIDPNLYVGTLSSISSLFQVSPTNTTGLTQFYKAGTNGDTRTDIFNSGTGGELYSNSAVAWNSINCATTACGGGNAIWLASENFAITNGGAIRNVSDFTASSDFQGLLADTAGQVGIFVKSGTVGSQTVGSAESTVMAGGNATSKNIDMIFTPDLPIAIIKSLATSLDAASNAN